MYGQCIQTIVKLKLEERRKEYTFTSEATNRPIYVCVQLISLTIETYFHSSILNLQYIGYRYTVYRQHRWTN